MVMIYKNEWSHTLENSNLQNLQYMYPSFYKHSIYKILSTMQHIILHMFLT